MRPVLAIFFLVFAVLAQSDVPAWAQTPSRPAGDITGSVGCIHCHEKFHHLWATSFHALAMRPYSDGFAKAHLTPMRQAMPIGQARYQARTAPGQGWVTEQRDGKTRRYRIASVLGGKDVLYFLTYLERGRLQTLPVAYDVHKQQWFDMAASGIRHFSSASGTALDWKDGLYTFNTSCRDCHVSQLSTNYDPATDMYRTTWTEPGINCETCHGPGREHVTACQNAPKGQVPADLRTIRGGRNWSHEQQNAQCSTCHAKAVALSTAFPLGARFFDHFDLVTYENADYYPDGRDLGENYTYTSWSRSPCVRSGKIDCLHCHTSSGRYKFADPAKANQACSPCHADRVANATGHTHHPTGSPGNRCISCHMPTTSFARIRRSDHSMLPPTPATTLAYGSPNACNACHTDKDAAWADRQVRAWRGRDYQAPVLAQAALIQAARQGDWSRLPEIVAYVNAETADPIVVASLLRLLGPCPVADKEAATLKAATASSPLVRAAAADALATSGSQAAVDTLATLTADDYRLVRVHAAASLSQLPQGAGTVPSAAAGNVHTATTEYLEFLRARPDVWSSQYSLGNYYLNHGDSRQAATCFETAIRLSPSSILPRVNASIAHARLGEPDKAQRTLTDALRLQPDNAAAHYNLGLLEAERGDRIEAEKHLRAALRYDPHLAGAAYNLGVLVSPDHPQEAITLCRQAAKQRPDIPNYAYTLAFYEARFGDRAEAAKVLQSLLARHPGCREAARLLATLGNKTP